MKNFTRTELIVVIVVIFCLAGMLLPPLGGAREKARRISCASNLKSIGHALFLYANDYNKVFSSGMTSNSVATTLTAKAGGLNRLICLDYLSDTATYNCPSTTDEPAKDGNTITTLVTERTCSYIYAPGLMTGTSDVYGNPDSALIADMTGISSKRMINLSKYPDGLIEQMTGNHDWYGNILFQGMHVRGFSGNNQEDWFLLNYGSTYDPATQKGSKDSSWSLTGQYLY
jgi:type II secretory pathway pseudopilin PulG